MALQGYTERDVHRYAIIQANAAQIGELFIGPSICGVMLDIDEKIIYNDVIVKRVGLEYYTLRGTSKDILELRGYPIQAEIVELLAKANSLGITFTLEEEQ